MARFIGCESISPGLISTVVLLLIRLKVPKLFQSSESSPIAHGESPSPHSGQHWLSSQFHKSCPLFRWFFLLLEHKATIFPQHSRVPLHHGSFLPRPCPPISCSYSSQPVFCFLSLYILLPSLLPAAKFHMWNVQSCLAASVLTSLRSSLRCVSGLCPAPISALWTFFRLPSHPSCKLFVNVPICMSFLSSCTSRPHSVKSIQNTLTDLVISVFLALFRVDGRINWSKRTLSDTPRKSDAR